MAMGYGGNAVITLDVNRLELLKLKSYSNLKKVLELSEDEKYQLYEAIEIEDIKILDESLKKYVDYIKKFNLEFFEETGIKVYLGYHDKENNGDIYDEVEGLYFELGFEDVYQMSEDAIDLSRKAAFGFEYFVHYG